MGSTGSDKSLYLSFLIREHPDTTNTKPDGLFVTAYDKNMTSRECLGKYRWSSSKFI